MNNRTLPLGELSTIQIGYSSHGKSAIKPISKYEFNQLSPDRLHNVSLIPFINVKDITEENSIATDKLAMIDGERLDRRTIRLRPGDILLMAHGNNCRAALIPREMPESICSALFHTIRIYGSDIIPEYLCWYLNHKNTMRYLRTVSIGSGMKFIPRKDIGYIPIRIPNIEIQRQIANITNAQLKENQLINRLLKNRNILVDTKLNKLLNNHNT